MTIKNLKNNFVKLNKFKIFLKKTYFKICYECLKRFVPPKLETCDVFLPKQPVPSLNNTIERYLESVECLLTKVKFINRKNSVN